MKKQKTKAPYGIRTHNTDLEGQRVTFTLMVHIMVGVVGFEPTASRTQIWPSTKLTYTPIDDGDGEVRTHAPYCYDLIG